MNRKLTLFTASCLSIIQHVSDGDAFPSSGQWVGRQWGRHTHRPTVPSSVTRTPTKWSTARPGLELDFGLNVVRNESVTQFDWTLCSALTDPNHRFYWSTRIDATMLQLIVIMIVIEHSPNCNSCSVELVAGETAASINCWDWLVKTFRQVIAWRGSTSRDSWTHGVWARRWQHRPHCSAKGMLSFECLVFIPVPRQTSSRSIMLSTCLYVHLFVRPLPNLWTWYFEN